MSKAVKSCFTLFRARSFGINPPNKNNWNNASKRLLGSYSHSGIPGFPFRFQEQNSRNIFLLRNILNERAPSKPAKRNEPSRACLCESLFQRLVSLETYMYTMMPYLI